MVKLSSFLFLALLASPSQGITLNREAAPQMNLGQLIDDGKKVIEDQNIKIKIADDIVKKVLNGDKGEGLTKDAALETVRSLYGPYHQIISGLYGYLYPNFQPRWDPDHNTVDMVTQEISDVQK